MGTVQLSKLHLRPKEKGFVLDDMQKVNSAYTKTTNPVKFVSESEVIYASDNTKEAAKLLHTIGFRMPIALQSSGFNGSVSEKTEKSIFKVHHLRMCFLLEMLNLECSSLFRKSIRAFRSS